MTWIHDHFRNLASPESGRRAIAGYRLGIKSGGAIRGIRIITGQDSCQTCQTLAANVYQPDDAPALPLAECTHPDGCRCAYRPVMKYEE